MRPLKGSASMDTESVKPSDQVQSGILEESETVGEEEQVLRDPGIVGVRRSNRQRTTNVTMKEIV